MSKASDRVKALLTQAADPGTTEPERATFALRAAQMFADNDLRVVDNDDEEDDDEESDGPTVGDLAGVANSIADVLGKLGGKKRKRG